MNIRKYITPWWLYFIGMCILCIWIADDAIQGKLTQFHGFLISAVALGNILMAHVWRAFYLREKEVGSNLYLTLVKAIKENEQK